MRKKLEDQIESSGVGDGDSNGNKDVAALATAVSAPSLVI